MIEGHFKINVACWNNRNIGTMKWHLIDIMKSPGPISSKIIDMHQWLLLNLDTGSVILFDISKI